MKLNGDRKGEGGQLKLNLWMGWTRAGTAVEVLGKRKRWCRARRDDG